MTETNPAPIPDGHVSIIFENETELKFLFSDIKGWDVGPEGLTIKHEDRRTVYGWRIINSYECVYNSEMYEVAHREWRANCKHVWDEIKSVFMTHYHTCVVCGEQETVPCEEAHGQEN